MQNNHRTTAALILKADTQPVKKTCLSDPNTDQINNQTSDFMQHLYVDPVTTGLAHIQLNIMLNTSATIHMKVQSGANTQTQLGQNVVVNFLLPLMFFREK